jgi:hypothetical protein
MVFFAVFFVVLVVKIESMFYSDFLYHYYIQINNDVDYIISN